MKKTILLAVFALGALSINAQTAVVEGGGFWDNWSMAWTSPTFSSYIMNSAMQMTGVSQRISNT